MSSPPPPPPPTQPISTFLDSETMGTLCKRSLSHDNQPTKARRIENTLYADYELIQAQYTYSIESDVLAHRLLRMNEYKQPQYKQPVFIAPMAKPSLQAPDETLFPLMGKVKDFLKGDFQVMLILGDSGAGKSTFNRQLELELWQDYKPGDRIPLLVNLPALERPERDLIAQQLRTHNFTDDQICELKQHRQFVLMCDGYDESQLHCNLHTNNFLDRYSQRDTKLIITCRPQYLGSDYRPRFVPKAVDEYNLAADDLFMEAIIAPFSEEQIEVYVGLYVSLEPRTWDMEDYMDKLKTIPNLMDLVKNPFLLGLCLEALPELVQSKFDLSRLGISRIQLYDSFVYHWLGVNKRRLLKKKLNNEETLAFNGLLDEGFENNGIKFQLGLAAAIFREQEGRPIVDYIERRDGASWKAEFFGPKPDVSLLRDASLIRRVGDHYRFVHISILEYFYSCTICKVADSNDEFAPHFYSVVKDIGDHPLTQRNLVIEPSIIQFLAERVRLGSCSKQELLALIEQSKTDERAACAAANAITILVKAGISFNDADLRGIRVPGADLSGGHFDSANLQQADLTGTSLTRSWIRKADFSMARMEGVQFGELPFLEEEHPVISVSYSLDGQSFAVGLENGDIGFYNTTSWGWTQTLDGHCGPVTGLAYSPCGLQLVSGSDDYTVKLWNIQAGSNKFVLSGHQDGVRAVAFSPLGDQIASASKDKTVRLWHSHTGVCLFALRDHIGWVDSVAYSPSGLNIISGGADGTIRVFKTDSEQTGSILEKTMDGIFCIAYSSDDHWITAGDDSGMLQLWVSATGKARKLWRGHDSAVHGIDFSPNSQWIASSSLDCTIKLWDVNTCSLLSVFAGHSKPVEIVVFSSNGLQLASGSQDRTVRLWDVTTTGTWLDMDGDQTDLITSVTYSADGSSLISGSVSGTVRRYDAVTGEPGLSFPCGFRQAYSVAFSPDGSKIATVGLDDEITIWSTEADVAALVLQGHTDRISVLAFSPDGQWIVSGSYDRTVRLWDACSGRLGQVLAGHSDDVLSVTISPCGLQVVSGSRDGTIRVWEKGAVVSQISVTKKPPPPKPPQPPSPPQPSIQALAIRLYSSGSMDIALGRFLGDHLELWDEKSIDSLHDLEHVDKDDVVVEWSSCGQWIATGSNNSVWLWSLIMRDKVQKRKPAVVIRDFLGGVMSIAWRPSELEFVTGSGSGCVQAWKLVDDSEGTFSARLLWSSGYTAFTATDAVLVGTIGLTTTNQRLLKQRGAREESSFTGSSTDNE